MCLALASKIECPLPHSSPQFLKVLYSETPSLDSLFTFASPTLSLTSFYSALFFFIALNTQFIEQCLTLAGTQEHIYWIGKFIENLEIHEFCISAHLMLGMAKGLALTSELCKWKGQYITLGQKLKETVHVLLSSLSFHQANSNV